MSHKLLRKVLRVVEQILGRRRLVAVARLCLDEARRDGPNDMRYNGERIVQRWALQVPKPIVFDVGAHFGEWSLALLGQPGSKPEIHAFEPSSFSFERAKLELGARARVHHCALSDHSGSAELHIVHAGAGSNSLVCFADNQRTSGECETVSVEPLDQLAMQLNVSEIRLLKIDAEGHDLAVLRGAASLLNRRAIDLVQFEYNSRWIDARRFLLDAFQFLALHRYEVGKLVPEGVEIYSQWNPELETFREANFLAWPSGRATGLPTVQWWGS